MGFIGKKSLSCTTENHFHNFSWRHWLFHWMASVSWHLGACFAIGYISRERLNWSVLKETACWMSFHPLLFFGTLYGPSLCSLPSPIPRQGSEWFRKGPIASQTAPLLKEPYLRAAHSALSASFSWGFESGRREVSGIGEGVDMAGYRCVFQPSTPQPCLIFTFFKSLQLCKPIQPICKISSKVWVKLNDQKYLQITLYFFY